MRTEKQIKENAQNALWAIEDAEMDMSRERNHLRRYKRELIELLGDDAFGQEIGDITDEWQEFFEVSKRGSK